MLTRPRSAGRPRLSGTTRTRSYFNSREGKSFGKDGGKDFPSLIRHSTDETTLPTLQNGDVNDNDVDTPPLIYSLVGNFDDYNDVLRTVKPQNVFVDDMQFSFSLSGITSFHRNLMLRDELRLQSELIGQPYTSSLVKDNEQTSDLKPPTARGPIDLLLILCHHIATLLMTSFGNMAPCNMRRCTKNDEREEPCQFEEDGLVVNTANTPFVAKSRNLLRLEERIRRESSLEMKVPILHAEHYGEVCPNDDESEVNDAATQGIEPITAKIDESYWLNPGQDLVGPEKRGGIVRREVNLTVDVGQIKIRQHPEFSAQERALARVSCLYDQYRTQIEANLFHYLVSRVTEICRKLLTINSNRSTEVKTSSDLRSMINPLLNDLKSSAAYLVTVSESIKSMVVQMKLSWTEFLFTKENDSSCRHADVELKTSPLSSSAKLGDALKELGDVIKSIQPVLSRFRQDELARSSLNAFQSIQEVETAVSNLTHIFEVIEFVQVSHTTERVKSRRRKAERYYARLLVNGHVVGDTKIERVDWASFSVKLGHRFNCKMIQKPTCTSVQIWKSSIGFLPDVLISSIAFLPELVCTQQDQLGSSQITATENWLQFSSNGSDVKGAIQLASRLVERTLKCSGHGIHMVKMPMHPKKLIGPLISDIDTYTRTTSAVKPQNRCCPDRQCMMEFRHTSGTLFTSKTLLEEPLRHALIKKRQRNPTSVPSHIPITELEVQNNDTYHDLIKSDAVGNEVRAGHIFFVETLARHP
jgi:hypothetical protein